MTLQKLLIDTDEIYSGNHNTSYAFMTGRVWLYQHDLADHLDAIAWDSW